MLISDFGGCIDCENNARPEDNGDDAEHPVVGDCVHDNGTTAWLALIHGNVLHV